MRPGVCATCNLSTNIAGAGKFLAFVGTTVCTWYDTYEPVLTVAQRRITNWERGLHAFMVITAAT